MLNKVKNHSHFTPIFHRFEVFMIFYTQRVSCLSFCLFKQSLIFKSETFCFIICICPKKYKR